MKRPKSRAQALRIDAGPDIRVARGEVEVLNPRDHNDAAVHGASLYDPLKRMVDLSLWLAAERFRDDYHLAEGVREGAGGGTPAWARSYPQRQLDALTATREALQVVGLRLSAVFVAVVIGRARPSEMERDLGMRNGDVGGLIREALTRLAAHYAKGAASRGRA